MSFFGCLCELAVLACCIGAVVTNALLLTSCKVLDLLLFGQDAGTLGILQWKDPEVGGECAAFRNNDLAIDGDTAFRVAQVGSMLSFGFGAVLALYILFRQYLCTLPCTQLVMDVSCTGVQISLGLVYVIWLSEICDDYDCVAGEGMIYLWVTQGLWLIVGCGIRGMREGRQARNNHDDDDDDGHDDFAKP